MSKTFNMFGGGAIQQPMLSVTVTNGTATSVTATKTGASVSLSYDSVGGVWYGTVSAGTWTVTATDGTHTQTDYVTVSGVAVYELSLRLQDIPNAYTQLEYVEATGNMDTGYQPVSSCKISIKTQILSYANWMQIFLATEAPGVTGRKTIALQPNSEKKFKYYNGYISNGTDGASVITNITPDTNTIYTISTSNRTVTINGSSFSVTSGNAITSTYGESITFGENQKIWYLTITEPNGTTLARDMIPAKRNSDSAVGMYDKVNGVFYHGSGWTAGPAV